MDADSTQAKPQTKTRDWAPRRQHGRVKMKRKLIRLYRFAFRDKFNWVITWMILTLAAALAINLFIK